MSTDGQDKPVPLDAVYESLAEEVEAWASELGTNTTFVDPVREDHVEPDWAENLRRASDRLMRTAVTLLTADGRIDQAKDLRARIAALLAAAEAYEQRLEAIEDRQRVHVDGIAERYKQMFGDDDPDAVGLWRLCRGMNRIWTLGLDGASPRTPEQFAKAVDRAEFDEYVAKGRAQADVRRQASELVEHLRLLAQIEAGHGSTPSSNGRGNVAQQVLASEPDDDIDGMDDIGGPEPDPYDPRVVRWVGKRLYLGREGTQVRELFWLLARRPGVPRTLGEVQRAVDSVETYRDEHGEQAFDRAMKRVAKALSKLRTHLREHDLDDHVLIVKEGPRDDPSYTLISRFGRS